MTKLSFTKEFKRILGKLKLTDRIMILSETKSRTEAGMELEKAGRGVHLHAKNR
jgi:hypothetical protein